MISFYFYSIAAQTFFQHSSEPKNRKGIIQNRTSRRKKKDIIPLSETLAGNTLTFPQVFFSSLAQVYMSSKIRANLKGKNISLLYVKALSKCYLGKPLTLFSKYVFSRLMTYWHIFRILEIHKLYHTPLTCSVFRVSSYFSPVNNVIRALLQSCKGKVVF